MTTDPITSKNFSQRAEQFISAQGKKPILFTIKPGSKAWDEWREYFQRYLRWTPWIMQQIINNFGRAGAKPAEMTVPTEYPQQFDRSFACQPNWMPHKSEAAE